MAQALARKILNNTPLKLFSLLLGYLIWHILSAHQTTTRVLTIPICFYNTTQDYTIQSPETITITLRARRSLFTDAYLNNLALHIDAQQLTKQTTIIPVSAAQLFLPENVTLIHYVPSPLIIEKTTQQTNTAIHKETVT